MLRALRTEPVIVGVVNVIPEIHSVLDRFRDFMMRISSVDCVEAAEKPLINVIVIGTGGSYLQHKLAFEALTTDPRDAEAGKGGTFRVLANVDAFNVTRESAGQNLETTLVIIISKTFREDEIMLNGGMMDRGLLLRCTRVRWMKK